MASIRLGVRVGLGNKLAAIWMYVATCAASLPFAIGAAAIIQARLGHSLSALDFARRLDPILWAELLRRDRSSLLALVPVLIGSLVAWTLVSTYLSGAIIGAATRSEPSPSSELWGAGGRAFGRLLRLIALGLPFVVLIAGGAGYGLFKSIEALTGDWVSEKSVLLVRCSGTVVFAVVFLWASGAYDLMRVEAVARGEHRARHAFVRGLLRALRAPHAVLLIQAPFALLATAITVLWSVLDARLPRASWPLLLVGLIVQQAMVFARSVIKIALLGSEVAFVMLPREERP
jgi:hypothetical protein